MSILPASGKLLTYNIIRHERMSRHTISVHAVTIKRLELI